MKQPSFEEATSVLTIPEEKEEKKDDGEGKGVGDSEKKTIIINTSDSSGTKKINI